MNGYDILVIGGGLSGIAFARFHLEIHPKSQLIVVEADDDVGGVWSASRWFDTFWSQSAIRMTGYSDVSFESILPAEAPRFEDTCEAKYSTRYLNDYLDHHIYNGASLRSRFLLGHRVTSLAKDDKVWKVQTESQTQSSRSITALKVVVASGMTSIPRIPVLSNQQEFTGQIIHHRDFAQAGLKALNDPGAQNVVVLGGGKSAADLVHHALKLNKKITWIIRRDGEGPACFFIAKSPNPAYRNVPEAFGARITSVMNPSSFMEPSWLTSMWHRSSYGIEYMKGKRKRGENACRKDAAYYNREKALRGFENLDFEGSPFWLTAPHGLSQHDELWDRIAQNVRVYRKNITSVKARAVVLEDGTEIEADIILCGTGWRSNLPFLSKELTISLGLPHAPEEDSPEDAKTWNNLLATADKKVLHDFPELADPPRHRKPSDSTTTARLYNCMAPLSDNSIVFVGQAMLSNSWRSSEAQAIWATAFLDGSYKLPLLEQARKEIAYMNAFSKRRYPSHGAAGDCIYFELVSYTDKLLRDLGLKSHRKGWFWWSDLWEPCLAKDLKGIPAEYRRKLRWEA